ncbi:MAG TPA: hypothetical protein VGH28_19240 [Polyangiaceae bacterium]|jgi:hypothetical protein
MRRAWLLLVVVFLFGGVAGAGGAYAWLQSDHATAVREDKGLSRHRLRALSRKLDLDRDQRERVATILEDDDVQSHAIGRDVVARCGEPLRAHARHVDDEIRAVLRPDQKRRFERIVEHRGHSQATPL